jgi:hypothetical protein
VGGADAVVDVVAVGVGGHGGDLGPGAAVGLGGDLGGGPVGAVDHHLEAVQVGDALQQVGQVGLDGVVGRRAQDADAGPDRAGRPVGVGAEGGLDAVLDASGSLKPSGPKNLMPLSGMALWEAEMTAPAAAPKWRVRKATAGVGTTPAASTSPPAERIPATRALSSRVPEARGSRPTSTAGRAGGAGPWPLPRPGAPRPRPGQGEGELGGEVGVGQTSNPVGPEQLSHRYPPAGVNAWSTGAPCGPS